MKVSSINNIQANKNIKNDKNKMPNQTNYLSNNMAKDSVSFGGAGAKAGNVITKIFKKLDNANFFVEFLIVDSCSMVIPRILVGLNRDKKELGHLNYKAAKEEAGREIFSGPSMNLIPMAILTGVSAIKPAARMTHNSLDGLTDAAKKYVSNEYFNAKDMEKADGFAKQLFKEAFDDKNFKQHLFKDEKAIKQQAFVDALTKSTDKKLSKKEMKAAKQSFIDLVKDINNSTIKKGSSAALDASEMNISGKTIKAVDLFEDFSQYQKDIMSKVSKETDSKKMVEMIDKLKKNRVALKAITAASAFFAVGGFLKILPKFYQQKGLSPAQESALLAQKQAEAAKEGGQA
ncbi:MAG: hypothetical protein MJ229_02770 [bacterium]|nr:hypothetical protein [bacterium]